MTDCKCPHCGRIIKNIPDYLSDLSVWVCPICSTITMEDKMRDAQYRKLRDAQGKPNE